MSDLTFQDVIDASVSRAKRWHPGFPDDATWNGADWSNATGGEVGEVGLALFMLLASKSGLAANTVKKLRRLEDNLRGQLDPPPETLLADLGEEIADVILYAVLLAAKYDIDLPKAIVHKFNYVSFRQGFPERLA